MKKKKIYDTSKYLEYSDIMDETMDNGIIVKHKNKKKEIDEGDIVINIHELDPTKLRPIDIQSKCSGKGVKYVTIGKPGTGKSILTKDILWWKKHIIPCAQFFNGTEDSNKAYQKIAPSAFISNDLKNYKLSWEDFKKRQEMAMEYLNNPWCVRIEDDMSTDTKIYNTPTYHDVFKNSRHWDSMYWLLLQFPMDIRPVIRTCIDGTFLFREATPKGREKLLNNFVPCIKKPDVFDAIMDTITVDYTALYINNNTQSNSMEDIIFYYKADLKKAEALDKIKFGSDAYWSFSNERVLSQFKN
jgi:hypothetical protein